MTDRIAFQSAGAVRKNRADTTDTPYTHGGIRERWLDHTRYSDGPLQNNDSPFMKFWKLLNDLMRSREQPELLYGEAKDWWAQHHARF